MSRMEDGSRQFHSEISSRSLAFDQLKEHQFVEYVGEILVEAGEIEECTRCSYQSRGLKVDGYYYDSEPGWLYLVVALWKDEIAEVNARVAKAEIEDAFNRCLNFFNRSRSNLYERIEIANEAHDLAYLIQECRNEILNITIIVITDGFADRRPAELQTIEGIEVKKILWDMNRILDFIETGKREATTVNFEKCRIPCLYENSASGIYTSYLAFIPGYLLAELYSQWGTRLLEMNLRVFLSARGKVNRGIRDTIISEPGMFCAYNNGITVVARNTNLMKIDKHSGYLLGAGDFQVVNGGQTVASLYHAKRRQKADLSGIMVPMKLICIENENNIKTLVPLISEYSNTQNKINPSDLAANDKLHLELHELSKRFQAPDPTGGSRISYWFYERSRGSYEETRRLDAKTASKEKAFDALYPKTQKFDKNLFGKAWNTCLRKPYLVSQGAQKNFALFNSWLKEQEPEIEPFFKQTVALLIMWRDAERVVRDKGFEGYRHNIVAYTLAWLFELTESGIDLEKIWREQKCDEILLNEIEAICQIVNDHIRDTTQNVTEWCKKEECWRKLLEKEYAPPDRFMACTVSVGTSNHRNASMTDEEREAIEFCKERGSEAWIELSEWARERNLLTGKEKSQCFNLGKSLDRGREPSTALALSCSKTWHDAELLGWTWKEYNMPVADGDNSEIIEWIKSLDSQTRRNQITKLADNGDEYAIKILLKLIDDNDDYTRCIAAKGLGKINHPASVSALIKSLKDKSAAVRKQSALALGRIVDIKSKPFLFNALNDADRSVRKAAKKSLSKIDRSSTD